MRVLKFTSAVCLACLVSFCGAQAQEAAPQPELAITVQPGTHIPLSLINSVSTKHSVVGDRVYMQTVFPIMAAGRIAIPPGTYVIGTVTELKRPGRVKGRGELFLRFDSMMLPNGVARDFRGRVSAVDGRADEKLASTEGKIEGDSNVGGDLRTVGEAAAAGAGIGELAAIPSHAYGIGAAAGAGAGAIAGLMGVLLTRGPDAVLAQGSTIEMVLDRPLVFTPGEVNFTSINPTRIVEGAGPATKTQNGLRPRFPF
jgi:type IV secretion system protein VirB10